MHILHLHIYNIYTHIHKRSMSNINYKINMLKTNKYVFFSKIHKQHLFAICVQDDVKIFLRAA